MILVFSIHSGGIVLHQEMSPRLCNAKTTMIVCLYWVHDLTSAPSWYNLPNGSRDEEEKVEEVEIQHENFLFGYFMIW